jgi:hypothetical protein
MKAELITKPAVSRNVAARIRYSMSTGQLISYWRVLSQEFVLHRLRSFMVA